MVVEVVPGAFPLIFERLRLREMLKIAEFDKSEVKCHAEFRVCGDLFLFFFVQAHLKAPFVKVLFAASMRLKNSSRNRAARC